MERCRNWIIQNWRPVLMFFLPFLRTYVGIDSPPEQIGQPNQTNQAREPNQTNQPNVPNQANNSARGAAATTPENRIYVNRRGGVTNIDEGRDIRLRATYTNDRQRLNDTNVPVQMPEGADMAIYGEGSTFRARRVQNITISETFGSNPNSPTDITDSNTDHLSRE